MWVLQSSGAYDPPPANRTMPTTSQRGRRARVTEPGRLIDGRSEATNLLLFTVFEFNHYFWPASHHPKALWS